MPVTTSSSTLAVTYREISELKPHPQNSRAHTRQQVKLVAQSIGTYGWTNPILIDDADNVIAGHARLEAARLLGMEQVPTIRLLHMTPAQKRAYIIADHRMSEVAGSWDRNILALEHQAIRLMDPAFDLSSTGFSLDTPGGTTDMSLRVQTRYDCQAALSLTWGPPCRTADRRSATVNSERHHHWTQVYHEKDPSAVSWFQAEPQPSLDALERSGAGPSRSFVDVGGGASNLVDALLDRGWQDVTVLDIAAPALEAAKQRLGSKADNVQWELGDITEWQPTRHFDVWHDRAVFHFLTEPQQRAAYCRALTAGTAPGSLVITATFALDGPEKCSGLPVQRYDAAGLANELGSRFKLIESWREEHATPWGANQSFNWCAFHRLG